jgi:glucose-fructose oxidoreductase
VNPRFDQIRYAVVGLGYIAQVAVLPAFRNARRNSRLAALVSGDPRKLRDLGRRYDVDRLYGYEQYAECLAEVDAVFIALPNHLHHSYAVAAAGVGVHVLCEKPLAVTVEECREMIEAARRHDVRLMTAYRLHFERATLRALELVREGRIGEPRIFHSAFSMQVQPGNIRAGREDLGGGPIYDLGVYCINAARHLFGAEPEQVHGFTGNGGDPRFAESHEMLSATMRFPGDRLASFTASNGAEKRGWYELIGTSGWLRMSPAYDYAAPLVLEIASEGRRRKSRFARRDQFAPELLEFSDCVLSGREPAASGEEGLADVRVVEALLRSSRTGVPVDLPPFGAGARPDEDQAIHKPPVDRPDLVHAEPPGRS